MAYSDEQNAKGLAADRPRPNVKFPTVSNLIESIHLGEKGRRIRELTSVVQKRFKFPENSVELYAEKVDNRGLCAIAQAESLSYRLLGGPTVRRSSKAINAWCNRIFPMWSWLFRACLALRSKPCSIGIPGAGEARQTPLPDLVTIHQPKEEGKYIKAPVVATEIPVLADYSSLFANLWFTSQHYR